MEEFDKEEKENEIFFLKKKIIKMNNEHYIIVFNFICHFEKFSSQRNIYLK